MRSRVLPTLLMTILVGLASCDSGNETVPQLAGGPNTESGGTSSVTPGTGGPGSGDVGGTSASTAGGRSSTGSAATGGSASGPCSAPSTYRNLFAELLSKSTSEVDAKIAAAYQQLFHGSGTNVYYEVGSDEAYMLDVANDDVRSEGMSYGMMISVQLDKKTEFDRLWKWAKQHMYQSSGSIAGLFAWQMSSSGSVISPYCAPDGEEYFATALIFASKRWGDGSGIFAYSTEARALLDAMATKGVFSQSAQLVTFGPSGNSINFTDPSYVLPAFSEVWSCFDTKNQAFWKSVTTTSRAFFQKATHATTGLAPEHAEFDGRPQSGSGDFRYDAWRVVHNVMMDHHFYNADPWQTTYAARLGAFFKGQGNYGSEYTLSGTKLNSDHSSGLVAMNATLGFGLPAADARPFVQELWDTAVPTGTYRYYNGLLHMLASLHVSGKFHLWY